MKEPLPNAFVFVVYSELKFIFNLFFFYSLQYSRCQLWIVQVRRFNTKLHKMQSRLHYVRHHTKHMSL